MAGFKSSLLSLLKFQWAWPGHLHLEDLTRASPPEHEIIIRKLHFLWTILQKNNDDLVSMVYTEKYPFKENWVNAVMKLRQKFGLRMDDASVETTGMNEWKYLIKRSFKTIPLGV